MFIKTNPRICLSKKDSNLTKYLYFLQRKIQKYLKNPRNAVMKMKIMKIKVIKMQILFNECINGESSYGGSVFFCEKPLTLHEKVRIFAFVEVNCAKMQKK